MVSFSILRPFGPRRATAMLRAGRSLLKPSGAPRRHLILIRHGQYDESASDDSGRVLTELGKRQAVAAGKRVAELLSQPGAVCRGVHSSRLARAVETADLIHAQLNNVPRLPGDPQLNEGVPCHAIPDGVHHAAAVYRDGARIEAAFRKYFKRALPWDEIVTNLVPEQKFRYPLLSLSPVRHPSRAKHESFSTKEMSTCRRCVWYSFRFSKVTKRLESLMR